ncbi:Nop14-like protein [Dissoconium aciculare CBS 342.82]|uniref:Nop14-like protein n=1 Tax=Dissoconium aciculare CBS 342.82 TaxID=1314786 RepID=A0A6J3LSR4_9PEZI|nr:Nop14-like protein [Dissoconium aciculare CBS 342.82]KAF1818840.1 Nop14-like protein [Dissoconium aciculare CBS 342.82]
MPASQLKRLKASLREQGITGPQKSKKQKKSQHASGDKATAQRVQRGAALQQIRESFNPFEYKAANTGRPDKFVSASQSNINGTKGGKYKDILHRPGVSKSNGEAMRRATLLPELQRRNKVGGVVDRRIGEGDVDMTPEERAAMRFAKEKENRRKGASLFDLEASDDERGGFGGGLTHGGKRIEDLEADDFDEQVSHGSDEDEGDDGELFRKKRPRDIEDDDGTEPADTAQDDEQPERKRSKKEIMQEVVAKSKMYKYERQKVKEDDDDLREALDKDMGDVLSLLYGVKQPKPAAKPVSSSAEDAGPKINPERQKLLDGMDRAKVDRDYDVRLKQLALDTRAKPSDRSKTAEEKAADEAERLRKLEEKRLKRMQGEDVSDDERQIKAVEEAGPDEDDFDEAVDFGFTSSNVKSKATDALVLDDEDEFALDEDLIASGSEAGLSDIDSVDESDDESDDSEGRAPAEDEEDEFIRDILGDDMVKAAGSKKANGVATGSNTAGIAYTYPCARNHAEFLEIVGPLPADQLITVIQRIRALYHPSLSATNKDSMADFSCALVDHLSYMALEGQPMTIAEQVIRHLHSLSRTYPSQIANAFRKHLAAFHERGQPTAGDLMILTAIGSIYPTSDHWHQVVTPAITLMAKWLSLNNPAPGANEDDKSMGTGAFLVALCLKYQTLSKRYIPEVVRYLERLFTAASTEATLSLDPHIENLLTAADMYHDKSAFVQTFTPFLSLLKRLNLRKPHARLTLLISTARLNLRPLELHHHRPLPIRMSIPKFEESFNPDKHYDPDKARSDGKKLQAEYKRERKGALRELRKDANFVAREQLREKKERDVEYEKKYRRLVAEVQNEEGAASREYEREKRARERSKKK